MDDSISNTFTTRSSSRNKGTKTAKIENNVKKKHVNKQMENVSKTGQQRIVTRSSQKTSTASKNGENAVSFMSNADLDFSQSTNSKKRQANDEKKMKTVKRPKITTYVDENQPPTTNEIQDIEQVKLAYETADGRTNLTRAVVNNAQIIANRALSNSRHPTITNKTFSLNNRNNIIDDTHADTLAIPDTLVNTDTQHNDSSWQRDIDRLMKKLEEQPNSTKSQIQIEETQIENEDEHVEIRQPILISQMQKISQQPMKRTTITTAIIQTKDIEIQTDTPSNSSTTHDCCQDISTCPCVIRYSKLEHLFMEKMSQFISIVPTIPNSHSSETNQINHIRRRSLPIYSRFRKFRNRRRTIHRSVVPSTSNDQSTTTGETSDEKTSEIENQIVINHENPSVLPSHDMTTEIENNPVVNQESPSAHSPNHIETDVENDKISTTVTKEPMNEISSIERVDETVINDQTSTFLLSSANTTYSTDRNIVLTASSLDESQKSLFNLFLSRFSASTSPGVDSTTTHIIVNDTTNLICPLTGKIIQGIARHLFVVSYRWLKECLAEKSIVDERPYEIRGDTSLGSDHGGMRRSRLTPTYLLDKYSICLRCTTSDCAPLQSVEQIQELLELCGARFVQSFSEIKTIDKQRQMVLVLGVNGFSGGEKKRKALLETCQQFNVRCVNIHWLLISIAKFEVQPFENYDVS